MQRKIDIDHVEKLEVDDRYDNISDQEYEHIEEESNEIRKNSLYPEDVKNGFKGLHETALQIIKQIKDNRECLTSTLNKLQEVITQMQRSQHYLKKLCWFLTMCSLINIILIGCLYLNVIQPVSMSYLERRMHLFQNQIDNLKECNLQQILKLIESNPQLYTEHDGLGKETQYMKNMYRIIKDNNNVKKEDISHTEEEEGKKVFKESTKENEIIPLQVAANNGDVPLVIELIKKGANINVKSMNDETSLHIAAQNGDELMVRTLLDHGAKLDCKNKADMTPLHFAAQNGHVSVVIFLLNTRANIHSENKFGWTALHWAAYNGHIQVLTALIKFGANIHCETKDGWTSLHLAAANGHGSILSKLVISGANINSKTQAGETAVDVAYLNGHSDIVNILRQKVEL